MVTGTSVVALKYAGGVVVAADTLGSYGSTCMFTSLQRLAKVGEHTLIGGSGEYSDFQYLVHTLEEYVVREKEDDDGATMDPAEIFSLVSQMMYNRRNKMDPLYNSLVIAGFRDGKSFLGCADLQGTNWEDNFVATGYGHHIGLPLLRKFYRPDLSKDEALKILEMCMRVLIYRDRQTINKVQFAVISADGVHVAAPRELATEWTSMEQAHNKAVQKIVQMSEPVK